MGAKDDPEVLGGVSVLHVRVMNFLKACDEVKDFIGTAQKLVDAWDADPDNYSQLGEGLSALNAAMEGSRTRRGDS